MGEQELVKSEYVSENFEKLEGYLGDLPKDIQGLIKLLPPQEKAFLESKSYGLKSEEREDLKVFDEIRRDFGYYTEEEVDAMSDQERVAFHTLVLIQIESVLTDAELVNENFFKKRKNKI